MNNTTRKIFINLPVHDLERSMDFFNKLGFGFDMKFTNDKGACMIVSDQAYVMLLAEPFFRTFTKREVCNRDTHTEALLAVDCAGRAEVDDLIAKAIAAGGKQAMEPINQKFMYGCSFYDLDGHHWEAFWMDPAAAL